MKKLFVFVLIVVLMVGTALPVGASVERSEHAGVLLAEVIDHILARYVGEPVSVNELVEAALRGMTDVLDQYSVYLTAEELEGFTESMAGRLVGIGVSMAMQDDGRVVIARVLPESPAQAAGVLAGDVLLYVDGVSVAGMPLDMITAMIINPDYARVAVTFERDGTQLVFDILKAEIVSPTVLVDRLETIAEAAEMTGLDRFRYMQISSISLSTGDDVRRAISQMQAEGVEGIILDLRGNTGGYLDVTIDIANQLVPQGVVLQTVNQAGRRRTYSSTLREQPFKNMIVLVNRFSASGAEVLASALQDSGAAVIIGEDPFGKGLIQSVYSIRTGGALKLTTEEYFRRNGRPINNLGVEPCIQVERRPGTEGPDPVLQKALELLLQD